MTCLWRWAVASFGRDDRGVTPVVEKSLAAGIALLYVAGMTGLLLGGVVPAYEGEAGDELADRVLATAASGIEGTPPTVQGDASVRREIELPTTVEGSGYRLVLSGRTLVLDHPADGIGGETRLSLPAAVTAEEGVWAGGGPLVVTVTGPVEDRTLAIGEGG
jgi:hypothetical protein